MTTATQPLATLAPTALRADFPGLGAGWHYLDTAATAQKPQAVIDAMANAMDVVPLLEPDPHGGSILREAMAAGRLALSVDGPSRVQRSFMHDAHAVLVPSATYLESAAQAVLALAADPARREALGDAAARYARDQMSFRRLAEEFLAGVARFE